MYNIEIYKKKGDPIVQSIIIKNSLFPSLIYFKGWIIDLRSGTGIVKEGKDANADATFTMSDDDFYSISKRELNP